PAPSGGLIMDTLKLREKAALCSRIAARLSLNHPTRLQLTDLADRFDRQAKEIETQNHAAQPAGIATANRAVKAWVRERVVAAATASILSRCLPARMLMRRRI